jgi:NAD(P)-dependent dehydrogenase (short-subunit alcohol dehydrogenase family)
MIPDIHKTVIVTGASQGIGAGPVKAFLDRRYNVVVSGNGGLVRELDAKVEAMLASAAA